MNMTWKLWVIGINRISGLGCTCWLLVAKKTVSALGLIKDEEW